MCLKKKKTTLAIEKFSFSFKVWRRKITDKMEYRHKTVLNQVRIKVPHCNKKSQSTAIKRVSQQAMKQ